MGKLCSKFGEDRSTNNVTFLSTDTGRTDGRLRDFIFFPMHMHSIEQTIKKALKILTVNYHKQQSLIIVRKKVSYVEL